MLDETDDIHPLFAGAPGNTEFKKLRKRIVRQTREAIEQYGMIERDARWLVCLSGGKDSYTLLAVLYELKWRGLLPVDILACNLDQGQPGFPATVLPELLERMEVEGIVLCVHGEVTDNEIDVFDREAEFIERHMRDIVANFPSLKVVFEHITTADAARFVAEAGPNVAATITPQHLHINRNAMLVGGIQPHNYCLPVAKRETHRLALRAAATSGSTKFFLGTDSAPHLKSAKETACGCAGIFNAPFALESYLKVFDEEGALDRFEQFASLNGPAFYDLPINEETITLERAEVEVPETLPLAGEVIVPWHGGETLGWRIAD